MARRGGKKLLSDGSQALLHRYFAAHRRPSVDERRDLLELVHAQGDVRYSEAQLHEWFKWQRRKAHAQGSMTPEPDFGEVSRIVYAQEEEEEESETDETSEEVEFEPNSPEAPSVASPPTPCATTPEDAARERSVSPATSEPLIRAVSPTDEDINATQMQVDVCTSPNSSSSDSDVPSTPPPPEVSTCPHAQDESAIQQRQFAKWFQTAWAAACARGPFASLEEYDAALDAAAAKVERFALRV